MNRALVPVRRGLLRSHAFVSRDKSEDKPEGNYRPKTRPDNGKFKRFDHLKYYCTNAYQSASFLTSRLGFEFFAYANLETGSRATSTHVVKKDGVVISFESDNHPGESEISRFVMSHGDTVRDIAIEVEDCEKIYSKAVQRGAKSFLQPTELSDEHGSVVMATVQGFGDLVHTLIDRSRYRGSFLPGFRDHTQREPLNQFFPELDYQLIDHVGVPQPALHMKPVCDYYFKTFDFHHFWSVDEKIMASKESSLRTTVVSDFDELVKMPVFEPAPGIKVSQTQEFIDFNGGPGAQHIALRTKDIIRTVSTLRKRGVQFLSAPSTYYRLLKDKFDEYNFQIKEDLSLLEKNHILVDFDENGYLLQIFTKPLQDRPTLFYEFIQRENHDGFGVGNFKRLFLAIEEEQRKRGNLLEAVEGRN